MLAMSGHPRGRTTLALGLLEDVSRLLASALPVLGCLLNSCVLIPDGTGWELYWRDLLLARETADLPQTADAVGLGVRGAGRTRCAWVGYAHGENTTTVPRKERGLGWWLHFLLQPRGDRGVWRALRASRVG